MNWSQLLLIVLFIFLISCKSENINESDNFDTIKKFEIEPESFSHGNSAFTIADSIMYIADVKNANPDNAYYMDEWLSGVDINLLADIIFKLVYEKKLKAYNYLSGKEMTVEEVRFLENEWKREDIGQILFTEDWHFDQDNLKFYKQVNSIMLGYYRYDKYGNKTGNKSGIRVYFNETKPMKGAIEY
jgi:hypothetical protein